MSLAENFFLQSQMQQQPQQNPIEKGAAAGIDAAQQSVAMSDMQRRRAEGAAIMQMSQHMFSPNYGHGLRGAMAAFSGGIEPATHAYLDAETRARAENMMMMERQDKLRKQAEEMALKERDFTERQRYHNELLKHKASNNDNQDFAGMQHFENLKAEGKLPASAIYLPSLPKGTQNQYTKKALATLDSAKADIHALETLEDMRKLIKDFPDLDKSFTQMLVPGQEIKPSTIQIFLNNARNQKEATAIQIWAKLNNNLLTNKIAGINGKVVTDIYKKALRDTLPQLGQTPGAKLAVIDMIERELKPGVEYAQDVEKALSNNGYIPLPLNKYLQAREAVSKPETSGFKATQEMTPEEQMAELEAIEAELNAGP